MAEKAAAIPPQQWALLAGVRFFLASIIVATHFRFSLGPGAHSWASDLGLALGAGAAVIGFLAISGYSIAHSLETPRGFYLRRFARIWPTLAVATALFAGLIWTLHRPGRPDPDLVAVAGTLLFLNGLLLPNWFGPSWSLAVEAFYYAIAPGLRRLSTWLVVILVAASAYAHWTMAGRGVHAYPDATRGLAHAGLFWAWGLGFLAYRERRNPLFGLMLLLGGLALLDRFNAEGGTAWPLTWIVAAASVGFGARLGLREGPWMRVSNYLGDLSYPLYLLHQPVFFLLFRLGLKSWWVDAPIVLAVSAACLHLVDRPLRRRLVSKTDRARRDAERKLAVV
jgi:peptidoglycan/LPS O-acetylase OafA/YrhL